MVVVAAAGFGGLSNVWAQAARLSATASKEIIPGLVMSSLDVPSMLKVINLNQLHILNLLVMAAEKFWK